MSYIIKAIILLGCAFMIAIQTDELGEALIRGYKGLFGVMLVILLMGLYHVWSFVQDRMEYDDDSEDYYGRY